MILMIFWKKKTYVFLVTAPMHYRLRGSMGFENYKKWTKVDTCFSFNKPTKQTKNALLERIQTQILHQKIYITFLYESLAKIKVNVQKSLKRVSEGAEFLHGENMDHPQNKNSKQRQPAQVACLKNQDRLDGVQLVLPKLFDNGQQTKKKCLFRVLKTYLKYLDTDKMRGKVEKFI